MITVLMPLALAKTVFDIAIGSMDFGSGMLDNEEVDQLRSYAIAIGVNPMEATPHGFTSQYPHEYKPRPQPRNATATWREACYYCNQPKEHAIHHA